MVKKLFGVLVFIVLSCSVVFAQNAGEKEKPKLGLNFNLGVGLSSYEDSTGVQRAFQKFSFLPELTYGKFGVGLDLTFEFDSDFRLRDLDNDGMADGWSTFIDYLYKIYYVRYGYRGDPFYVRIGGFDTYTLGHGMIMDRFSNTLFYPQVHQLGLNLNIDGQIFKFPYIGMESVVDDVFDWDIIGMRIYTRPLINLPLPIVNKLKIGATVVTDLDTKEVNNPADPNYTNYSSPMDNPGSEKVIEVGVDVEVPLIEQEDLSLVSYTDWAFIGGKGTGAFVGSTFTYQWIKLFGQVRFLGEQFVVNYFDAHYERDRATKYASLDAIDRFTVGYLLGTELGLFKILNFYFIWSDVFSGVTGPGIQTGIYTQENALPKIDASFSYDKKDISSFSDLFSGEDTLLELQFGYRISSGAKIVFTFQRTYEPSGRASDKTFVETQFSF